MLTAAQKAARDGKVNASFLPSLMAGDEARIIEEWKWLIGDPSYTPPDFSDNWPVNLGSYIEPFALDWHQAKTGQPLIRRGESVTHPTRPYVGCTLDAFRASDRAVIDCKAPGAWRNLGEVCSYYAPQLAAQRACTEAERAILLIVHGSAEPVEYPLDIEPEFERVMWERVDAFWRCVETLTPPFPLPPPTVAALRPERIVHMDRNNAWSSEAAVWLANHEAKDLAIGAEKALKEMVPADAARCHGFGVVISRDRAGRLALRELKP